MKLLLKNNNVLFRYNDEDSTLKDDIKLIDTAINRYDKLNNKTKYKLLEHFYSFYLEDIDLIEFINIKYNKNFNKIISIPTKIEEEYFVTNNYGYDIQKYEIIFRCATNDNFVLENKKYSHNELTNLIENGMIYLIDYHINEIKEFNKDRESFKYIKLLIPKEINIKNNSNGYMLQSVKNSDIDILMNLINNTLTKAKLFNDLKTYTQDIINIIEKYDFLSISDKIYVKPKLIELYKNTFKNKNNT